MENRNSYVRMQVNDLKLGIIPLGDCTIELCAEHDDVIIAI